MNQTSDPSKARAGGDAGTDVLAEAERHDSAGRHDDAVNVLARATKAGDVAATTALGMRLLVGDRAPALPREGARFLIDATRLGGAEAPARLAVLAALGLHVTQSWEHALDLAIVSAERGWENAQGQIAALATDRSLARKARRGAKTSSDIWRRLGKTVDLDFWRTAAAEDILHESPSVRRFRGLVPEAVCAWLIDRARPRLVPAQVYDATSGETITNETRTNTVAHFDLAEADLVSLLVQSRMEAACGLPIANMEAASVLHYDVGEEISNHYDFVDPNTPTYESELRENGQRIITFLAYLNADYEGGETEFPKLGVTHKGTIGEGLYFVNALPDGAPDLRMIHAGRPPTSGEKWILSQFIRDRRILRTG